MNSSKISPLAPSSFTHMSEVQGVMLATIAAGLKYKNRDDVMLAVVPEGTQVAGVFTRSKTASANVVWGQESIKHGTARVLLVNAGNANAFNGKSGEESVERIVTRCADEWECHPFEVLPCATGVIGEPLDDLKITAILSDIKNHLSPSGWEAAAKAIMTTDTFPKGATRKAMIGAQEVTINGIAKGSGMIAPDMATMLAYLFTDANLPHHVLQPMVADIVDQTFNCITVDSDTSTSDTLLMFATGLVSHPEVQTKDDPILNDFKEKLYEVMLDLAQQVVRDGEGATKFITVHVDEAETEKAARKVGLSIANSPLVKTAIAGEDANWGRIVMAVGKAGEKADRDTLSVSIGGVVMAKDGQLNPDYDEAQVMPHMQGQEIDITVKLGVGGACATVWTCDLTHGYISINADYRS